MSAPVLDYKVLGAKLKQARADAGYSQNDVAQWFGITYQNVSSWERGASKVDIDSLLFMCEKYDIDFSSLLQESKINPPTASDGRIKDEFANLFSQLNPEQRDFVVSAMRGMRQDK